MSTDKKDNLPWLLLPCVMLTLGGVTLLAPHQPAQAAPSAGTALAKAEGVAYDDGDGDELLEHWGDPRYAREERVQMAGIAGGFLLLSGLAWRKRTAKKSAPVVAQDEPVELRKAA